MVPLNLAGVLMGPMEQRKVEVEGSGGHGIFRWEPLGEICQCQESRFTENCCGIS